MSEEDPDLNSSPAAPFLGAVTESVYEFIKAVREENDLDSLIKLSIILDALSASAKIAFTGKHAPDQEMLNWTEEASAKMIEAAMQRIIADDFDNDIRTADAFFEENPPDKRTLH